VLVGKQTALHVAVTVPPGATVPGVELSVAVGQAVTVKELLVAIAVPELAGRSRTSYVPGETDEGIGSDMTPAACPSVKPKARY